MTTKAEQIAQAVVNVLTTPSFTDIHRDWLHAVDRMVSDAISVELGDEPSPSVESRCDRSVDVVVTCMAKGASAPSAVDGLHAEVFERLMADKTLGGICYGITEGPTRRARQALEKPVFTIEKTYIVRYQTERGSL